MGESGGGAGQAEPWKGRNQTPDRGEGGSTGGGTPAQQGRLGRWPNPLEATGKHAWPRAEHGQVTAGLRGIIPGGFQRFRRGSTFEQFYEL